MFGTGTWTSKEYIYNYCNYPPTCNVSLYSLHIPLKNQNSSLSIKCSSSLLPERSFKASMMSFFSFSFFYSQKDWQNLKASFLNNFFSLVFSVQSHISSTPVIIFHHTSPWFPTLSVFSISHPSRSSCNALFRCPRLAWRTPCWKMLRTVCGWFPRSFILI